MTQREFFTAVMSANVSDDLKAFAAERIAHLDTVNANRKSKGTPAQRENAALIEIIYNGVEFGKPYTAKTLADKFGISSAKATALAGKMVENGQATYVRDRVEKGKSKVNIYTFTAPAEGQGDDLDTPEDIEG